MKTPTLSRGKRALVSYQGAVQWIASNDDPTSLMDSDVEHLATVQLVATFFSVSAAEVAKDVLMTARKARQVRHTLDIVRRGGSNLR